MISIEKEKIERVWVVWWLWSYVKENISVPNEKKKSDSMSTIMNGYTGKHANIQNK